MSDQKMKTFQRCLKPEELTIPGYYWWLPECFKQWPDELECWDVKYFHPLHWNRPKDGLFWGPLEPPVPTPTDQEEEHTPKICP